MGTCMRLHSRGKMKEMSQKWVLVMEMSMMGMGCKGNEDGYACMVETNRRGGEMKVAMRMEVISSTATGSERK